MDNHHEQKEFDEEKVSREDAGEARLDEIFYVDPKAESRYVAQNTLPDALLDIL